MKKRVYVKSSHKYWNMKKINKYSMKIWYSIITLMSLFVIWALINYIVNKEPLISPIVSISKPVYANEIKKEDTRPYQLYQLVRRYESNNGTQGLAVTCKNKGMINEVGWLPVKGFCFKSEWDQELTIIQTFEKKLNNGWTESEVLCYHNTGMKQKSCAYSIGRLHEAN